MTYYNRRMFLQRSAAGFAAGTAALHGLGQMNAFAANTSGYKAMICLQLYGGMDHGDTIIPKDAENYNKLKDIRSDLFRLYDTDNASSSRNREALLKLNAQNAADFGGREFALPANMTGLHSMFESGDAAIIGNVGPLLEHVDRAAFESGQSALPPRLFSHNDQQSTWMSGGVEGARTGWGGRFSDCVLQSDSSSNPLYMSMSTANQDVFLAGDNTSEFRVPGGSSGVDIRMLSKTYYLGRGDEADAARAKLKAFLEKQEFGHTNLFRRDAVSRAGSGIQNISDFNAALETLQTRTTTFPDTKLGRQLSSIADVISLRGTLGVSRQMFFAGMGGFDTHSDQQNRLPVLQSEISEAMAAFRSAMVELGVWNDVVLFTMSDFGRTTINNGDGTDHGWGNHHFVAGGAVQGGRIYGDLPTPEVTGARYTESRGRLIPSVAVEQYAATLGSWFGLDNAELATTLPNLSRFDTQSLGFMGGSV